MPGQRRRAGRGPAPVPRACGPHVEVLQVDAVHAVPGGEVEEPQREADAARRRASTADVPEQRRAAGANSAACSCSSVRWHCVGARARTRPARAPSRRRPARREDVPAGSRTTGRLTPAWSPRRSSRSPRSCRAAARPSAGSTEPLAPVAPASLVASLNSWCRFGYFSKCGGLEVVGPQHPQVVLDQLGALLLDDQGAGAELRVGVGLVLLADRLDRLGLDPGLRRVVDAARQVAVGADDGARREEGAEVASGPLHGMFAMILGSTLPRYAIAVHARRRATRWQLPLFAVLVQGPVDGARRCATATRCWCAAAAAPSGPATSWSRRFRSRPDLLVVKRAVRAQDGGWWVRGRQRVRSPTTPGRTGWPMSSGGWCCATGRGPGRLSMTGDRARRTMLGAYPGDPRIAPPVRADSRRAGWRSERSSTPCGVTVSISPTRSCPAAIPSSTCTAAARWPSRRPFRCPAATTSRWPTRPGVARVCEAIAADPALVARLHLGRPHRRRGHRRLGRARPGQHRPARRDAGHGGQGRAVQAVRRRRRGADLPRHPGRRRDRRDRHGAGARRSAASTSRTSPRRAASRSSAGWTRRCDIPVFHDDQHGTAIVVLAALRNAAAAARPQARRPARGDQRRRRGRRRGHQDADRRRRRRRRT